MNNKYFRVDSVDGESDSASTQCLGDESSQNRHKKNPALAPLKR
jgi:hypothetical protein